MLFIPPYRVCRDQIVNTIANCDQLTRDPLLYKH